MQLHSRVGLLAVWIDILRFGAGDVGQFVDVSSGEPKPRADIVFRVDARSPTAEISPLIYGSNTVGAVASRRGELTLGRVSGNRLSTYNWETNASSAGLHNGHLNDDEMVVDEVTNIPAAPFLRALEALEPTGASLIVTVPALGWVAADTAGYVPEGTPVEERYHRSVARKQQPFAATPALDDAIVFEDELVSYLVENAPAMASRTLFCIDNEPSLWHLNFPRAHPEQPTYAEVTAKNIEYAAAVKDVFPDAVVLGGVFYGWDGWMSLQEAPDRFEPQYAGRSYLEVFLAAMRDAEVEHGRRLIDALDLHWYPEARGDGERVTSHDYTPGLVAARLQAPRSLWDPTYVEESWITERIEEPIVFLPWLMDVIERNYPGTKLVISEYDFGGGAHISGALAEADVLGIFGRSGVWAAALWELDDADHGFVYAAMAMYRNYDGRGGRFGDLALRTSTSDSVETSIYAALDSAVPGRLTLVAINKTSRPLRTLVRLEADASYARADSYVLTAAARSPVAGAEVPVTDDRMYVTLPPMSVTTFVLDAD